MTAAKRLIVTVGKPAGSSLVERQEIGYPGPNELAATIAKLIDAARVAWSDSTWPLRIDITEEPAIPQPLVGAFQMAIRHYRDIDQGHAEHPLTYDGDPNHTIVTIAKLVARYNDKMPRLLYECLWRTAGLTAARRELDPSLPGYDTYAAGGRCLERMYDARKDGRSKRNDAKRKLT